jgi:hypothetical protein
MSREGSGSSISQLFLPRLAANGYHLLGREYSRIVHSIAHPRGRTVGEAHSLQRARTATFRQHCCTWLHRSSPNNLSDVQWLGFSVISTLPINDVGRLDHLEGDAALFSVAVRQELTDGLGVLASTQISLPG